MGFTRIIKMGWMKGEGRGSERQNKGQVIRHTPGAREVIRLFDVNEEISTLLLFHKGLERTK